MDNDPKALVERLRHCSTNTRDEYLHELTGRAADLIERQAAEIAEQCRVNGMGSEREAVLMGMVARLEAENERLRRNIKGWLEWHRRCDADDDCTYLNDNAWCDAEALASTGMGLIAREALEAKP